MWYWMVIAVVTKFKEVGYEFECITRLMMISSKLRQHNLHKQHRQSICLEHPIGGEDKP